MPTIENPPPQPPPSQWPDAAGHLPGPPGRKPAPSPEQVRERLLSFLVLLLGLIVVSQLSLPFRLGGLALAVVTGWVGIRLLIGMSALGRAGKSVGGRPSVIIGLGLTFVLALTLAYQAALYPIAAQHERCLSGANTQTAADTCTRLYRNRLADLEDDLRRRSQSPG